MGRVLGLTFIAQLIIQLQGLIVMPIILRWAGPATYGAYTILFVTAVVCFELATSSISYPYVRNLVSAATPAERRQLFEPQITFSLAIFGLVPGDRYSGNWRVEHMFLGPVAPGQRNRQKIAARSELSIRMLV